MNEASKTRAIMGDLERSVLKGDGIDIGCGPDPITPDVQTFDVADGDANRIDEFVHKQFDFVFSSHCLEHMHDPYKALASWWKLVKPGGFIYFLVPDEDLYEQGVFPSRFNSDHKATFTISKSHSWSPRSVNVFDLARSLDGAEIISLVLQDKGYDRRLLSHGKSFKGAGARLAISIYQKLKGVFGLSSDALEVLTSHFYGRDQTSQNNALAQIQCILRKRI